MAHPNTIKSYMVRRDNQWFRVEHIADDSGHPPWDREDGHGPVSKWERRGKRPGEMLLNEDGGSKRFYDFWEATVIAKRDGWGLAKEEEADLAQDLGRPPTRKQVIREAVMRDFRFLQGFCRDEWGYIGVGVEHVASGMTDSLWGIESNSDEYLKEVEEDLLKQLLQAVINENPTALLPGLIDPAQFELELI